MSTVKQNRSKRNVPPVSIRETSPSPEDVGKPILTVRGALILGASLIVGLGAAVLAYLSVTWPALAVLTGAIIAGVLACAGAIRLFSAIIG